MRLTSEEKQRLLSRGYGPGHRHFTCCPVCGNLEWRMTQSKEPDDVTVQEDTMGRGCFRCAEAFSRNPELVQWVMAVLSHQRRKMEAPND